ncbi:MAG: nicotinate-nucleotide adenylyltransferase [Planctomycetia bacterium]
MRLGLLGGTFDPVHYGHLLIAESCRETLHLDHVRFLPAALSPHKTDRPAADGHARADMIQLAIAGCREFSVDRRELRRSGPSFTIDTLQEFQKEFPDAELFLLMGADSLKDFLTWKNPQEVARLATLVACNRPGLPALSMEQITAWVGPEIAARVIAVEIPGTDISASEIRARALNGKSLRFLTPKAVEAFLGQHQLYSGKPKPIHAQI